MSGEPARAASVTGRQLHDARDAAPALADREPGRVGDAPEHLQPRIGLRVTEDNDVEVVDKQGKPVGIQRHIGRRPIAKFDEIVNTTKAGCVGSASSPGTPTAVAVSCF